MKKVLSLLMVIVLMSGMMTLKIWAEEKVYVFDYIIMEEELWYKIVENEAHVYKCFSNKEYICVPSEIEGYRVTTICRDAFLERNNLQEVFISDGVTEIVGGAFKNCENLRTVTLPSELSDWTDAYDIFHYCNNLEKIIISESVISVPRGFLRSFPYKVEVVLPETVEEIGDGAFTSSDITKINLEKVKRINSSAFRGCEYLKEADLRNVEYLGEYAFMESGIESICMPKLKSWNGVVYKNIYEDGTMTISSRAGHAAYEIYRINCMVPIRRCNNLKTVRINYPETEDGGYHDVLILECPNVETVIIENIPKNFNKWDFSYNIEVKNSRRESYEMGKVFETVKFGKMPPNMTIYGKGEAVKEYAETIGVLFRELIDVNLDGERIWMDDCLPYIKNGRTMVPMRAIFEALGAEVSWDDTTKTAVGVKDGEEVKITIGENVIYRNGEGIELDCAAEITNNRTMVPVRVISEAFGCSVNWIDETKTVEITN